MTPVQARIAVSATSFAIITAGATGQCVNDCGIGDVAEGEACPGDGYVDATNGGCNSGPPVFTAAACNETICGTASTFDVAGEDHRDTDWYTVSQAQLDAADIDGDGVVELRATLTSEFSGLVAIFTREPDCSNIIAKGTAGFSEAGCSVAGVAETFFVVDDHPLGALVIVAPDVFDGFECGTGLNDYTLLVECDDAPTGCVVGAHPCNEVSVTPGCGDPACCNTVCAMDAFCCDTAWDEVCVGEAIDAGCAAEPFPDVCLATGDDPGVDGYLEVCVDPYGAWASESYGGSGDLFNPLGADGPQPVAFTSGFLFVNPWTLERELLANNTVWQSLLPADATLDREIILGSIASDTDGDGVDDKAFSMFRVTGAGFSLRFYLEQQVAFLGGGVSTLTQAYAVINESGVFLDFILVRQLDGDLIWDGGIGNDSVGTGTIGSPGNDRHVFMQDVGDDATAVTLSMAPNLWESYYYGAKAGVDPDDAGSGPPFGGGTGTEVWDNYGIPSTWVNFIAGVGADTDGQSGASPAGCTPPCDAGIAIDQYFQTDADFDPILTVRHTFGDNAPVDLEPCGALVAGSCVAENNTPGCDNKECCELVCALDAFCCDTGWDFLCVESARMNCEGFVHEDAEAAGRPRQETVGDLNGDGIPDAVAVLTDQDLQSNGAVQVFLNLGTFGGGQWLQFVPLTPITVGRDPSGVAAGFFDNDDHLDLAVTNATDGTVTVLLNTGLGNATFTESQVLPVGTDPSDITALGALAGTNLAVTLEGDGAFVRLDNTGGVFSVAPSPVSFLNFGPGAIAADDFDNNKDPDVVGAGHATALGPGPTGKLFVANALPGGAYDVTVYDAGTDPGDIATGDLNDDGKIDIVVPDAATGEFRIRLGDGNGGFPTEEVWSLPSGSQPKAVTVADMDSDGCKGLVLLDADFPGIGPAVLVLPRQCGAGFEIGFAFGVNAIPQAVEVTDVNGDCVPDIVTANEATGGVGGSVSTLLSTLLPTLFPCCPWDIDGSGHVGVDDFLALLAAWGTDPGGPPDFDFDGNVGVDDFLALLAHWGSCPEPPAAQAQWNAPLAVQPSAASLRPGAKHRASAIPAPRRHATKFAPAAVPPRPDS